MDGSKCIMAGVPFCVGCLDTMRVVRNDAMVVCPGGAMRRAYKGDLYECRRCGARVFQPAMMGIDISPGEVGEIAASGEEVILMEGV